jgi:3-methylcrotonyl-CoA carboxylase alpha subunit
VPERIVLRYRDRDHIAEIIDPTHVRVDGETVEVARDSDGVVRFVNGPAGSAWTAASRDTRWVFFDGRVYEIDVTTGASARRGAGHHGSLTSPMPATVRQILVAPGAKVARGDTVVILEAMKMELPVRAPANGVVASIHCREGELVQPGVALVEIAEG